MYFCFEFQLIVVTSWSCNCSLDLFRLELWLLLTVELAEGSLFWLIVNRFCPVVIVYFVNLYMYVVPFYVKVCYYRFYWLVWKCLVLGDGFVISKGAVNNSLYPYISPGWIRCKMLENLILFQEEISFNSGINRVNWCKRMVMLLRQLCPESFRSLIVSLRLRKRVMKSCEWLVFGLSHIYFLSFG